MDIVFLGAFVAFVVLSFGLVKFCVLLEQGP